MTACLARVDLTRIVAVARERACEDDPFPIAVDFSDRDVSIMAEYVDNPPSHYTCNNLLAGVLKTGAALVCGQVLMPVPNDANEVYVVKRMSNRPMTEAEARAWLKRPREESSVQA